jgi:hypothetical protein
VSFRIFLLSLVFLAGAANAQENAPVEPAPPPAAVAAPGADPAEASAEGGATQVPLDPSALLAVGTPRSAVERDEMAAQAITLRGEAELRKQEAEKVYETAKIDCWKKFLVSRCLDDARLAYRKEISLSKRQERQAQALERNVRKFDALEHARLRDEENARRDAENAKKAEEYRAKRAAEEKARAQ